VREEAAIQPPLRRCQVLIPGDWLTPTGGFVFDRHMVLALRARGWDAQVLRLDGDWPFPDAAALAEARRRIAAVPDGETVLADGLAFGVLGEVVAAHSPRLRWLALVHHPLHLETGLSAAQAAALRTAETEALRHARRVVVPSAATARDLAVLGVAPQRTVVIEPGNHPVPPPAPRRQGAVQLLCVATLTARKDHALLLDALEGLVALDWVLHCVGSTRRDPALAVRLRARCAASALAGRVHWHGELEPAALQQRYASADLLLLASRHEGFGMVVNEALMHGLPVLASRAGALVDTVPAQAGWLLPPGDVASWRAALARLITEPAERAMLSEGARRAAAALPSWDRQAALLEAVLAGRP